MFKLKQKRHKPFYKKFIALRVNAQNRKRLQLLKFKKQKWQRLISYLRRIQYRRKKKFKFYDLNKYYLPKLYNPFTQKYKILGLNKKKIDMFYGGIRKNYLKNKISLVFLNKKKILKTLTKINLFFLSFFEKRLDVILYRSHFTNSIRNARQLIHHRHVKINDKLVTSSSYNLKQGDLISINKKIHSLVFLNLAQSYIWPLPPKYLQINYKTFKIIYHSNLKFQNLSDLYPFRPEISLLLSYYK